MPTIAPSKWIFAPRSLTLELKKSFLTKTIVAQLLVVSGYLKYGCALYSVISSYGMSVLIIISQCVLSSLSVGCCEIALGINVSVLCVS